MVFGDIRSLRKREMQGLRRALIAPFACAVIAAGLLAASSADARTSTDTLWQTHPAGRSSSSFASGSSLARLGLSSARPARSMLFAKPALAARQLGSAALAEGGAKIEGVVTVAETGEPLEGIEACAYTFDEEVEGCAISGPTGGYQIAGLPPGQYDVEFLVPEASGLDYVTQYYNGKSNEAEADPVTLGEKEEEVAKEVNAAMTKGADIKGKVVSASTKAPLAEMVVCALRSVEPASVENVRCTLTAANGSYTLIGLAAGRYEVEFRPIEPEFGGQEPEYGLQYYNGKLRFAEAEPVELAAPGSVEAGIDAELHLLPLPTQAPVIVGGPPVQGVPLSFIQGSWSNGPTSVTDEWGRCNASGGKCFTIAEGHSYTPTAEDVGHTLRIREEATNEFGKGRESFSAPTAIVVAPPRRGAEIPPPPPAGTGPAIGVGGSGVLESKTTVASAAQLKSLLLALLTPRGAAAKIGALKKHHGYTVSFGSLVAGKLSISWYEVPKGAHLAAAKPTLVASGSVVTGPSGTTKLTLKLTASGKKLIAHGGRLTLTAKGTLTPSGRSALRATHSFTLKH